MSRYRRGYRHGRRDQRHHSRTRPSMWFGRLLILACLVMIAWSIRHGGGS